MFWKILLALAGLADKIIDRFIPSRKEKEITQYQETAKDVLRRHKDRHEKQRQAHEEAKAALDYDDPNDGTAD